MQCSSVSPTYSGLPSGMSGPSFWRCSLWSWSVRRRSLVEKMPFADALYFAFVTALTIGYGDIVMHTPVGRLIALLIGLVGILFSGLIVAVLVHAVRESIEESEK